MSLKVGILIGSVLNDLDVRKSALVYRLMVEGSLVLLDLFLMQAHGPSPPHSENL